MASIEVFGMGKCKRQIFLCEFQDQKGRFQNQKYHQNSLKSQASISFKKWVLSAKTVTKNGSGEPRS